MRPNRFSFTLAEASANAICTSQKPLGAGDLTINGALAVSAMNTSVMPSTARTVARLDRARHVAIASSGNDSGVTFTVTGTDVSGVERSETVAGPNTTSVSTTLNFVEVRSVSISGAAMGNITVGTNDNAETQWIQVSNYRLPFQAALEAQYSTGTSVTVQWQTTLGNIQDLAITESAHLATNAGSALTASGVVNLTTPVIAVRAKITNFVSGTVLFTVLQE